MDIHPIKQWLEDNGKSSTDLGKACGLTGPYVRAIYLYNTDMSKKACLKLAEATRIHPVRIMFPELKDIVIMNN